MGGFGSGSWQVGRPTVESAITLSITDLMGLNGLQPNCEAGGTIAWSNTIHGEIHVAFDATLGSHSGTLRLRLNGREQWIGLTSTPGRFGGRMWFFEGRRGQRVRKLYLPPGGRTFASRHDWRLAYTSTREQPYDRALRQARKIRRRLGCEGVNLDAPWPEKPTGMHVVTYERHLERLDGLERQIDQHLLAFIARL